MDARRLLLPIALLLLSGCPQPTDTSMNERPSAGEDGSTEGSSVEAVEEAPPIDVTLASWAEVEKEIAQNSGKVVVVDLWSTSCAPCTREFPHLVELHGKHDASKLTCIGVSLDYYGDETEPPESFRPAVEEFLAEVEAPFPNYICTDSSDDVYSKVKSFGVPIVLVYGPDGKLAKLFEDDGTYGDEGFTYSDHIEPLVKELLP